MNQFSSADPVTCRRCGACCRQGGPALHGEDRALIDSGALARRDLVAIRAGEPAFDQRQGRVAPAAREFLKLAGARGSWSCTFYHSDRGCGIYAHRPLECRLLLCRDTGPLEAVMGRDLLSRRELLAADDQVLLWLARLEREIDYGQVRALLSDPALSAGVVPADLTRLVRADLVIRAGFLASFPARASEELFLLGRPLFLALAPYGFRVSEGPAGVELHFGRPGGLGPV